MTQTILLMIGLATIVFMAISFYWNDIITKFVVLAMFVVLANSVYFSLDGVKGWPAEEPTSIEGTLASVTILNPSGDDPGAIFISVFLDKEPEWYEYHYHRRAPKTYYVAYSNNRASEFQKADDAMKNGREVHIRGIPPKGTEGGEPGEVDVTSGDFLGKIKAVVRELMSKNGDTYTPQNAEPELEIVEPIVPRQKDSTP